MMSSTGASCWLPNRPESANVAFRVFCLPHAGGAASTFRSWIRDQPPGGEICAVQFPGREERIRESFPTDICTLAQVLAAALLPDLGVPYVLIGNSMGALVAFELARCLQQRYFLPPFRLVAAASVPPGTDRRVPEVSGTTDEELLIAMQNRYGGIPREVLDNPRHLAAFLPALRADMAMLEAYLPPPGPPLDSPITAVVGTEDIGISRSDLEGWSKFTKSTFDCVELPGDHFALLHHPADVLRGIYAEAAQSG
jgi:medium-chain acyl-[acyl-carrier-protein] hydrolase